MQERNGSGTSKLPLIRKIGYSVGHSINSSLSAYTFSYLVVFTKIGLKLDLVYAGYFMLASQIANAVVSPIAGILSDKYNGCCCCGKRKSWYIFAVIFRIMGFSLMFCVPWEEDGYPDYIRFYYFLPMIIVNGGANGAILIPHLAILTDISQLPLERVQLAGWRNVVAICSNVFMYMMAWILLYINKGTDDNSLQNEDANTFRYLGLCAVASGILCSAAFCILVKEKHANTCMSTRCVSKCRKQKVAQSVIENNNSCFEFEENKKSVYAMHTCGVKKMDVNIRGTDDCCYSNPVSTDNSHGIAKFGINVSHTGHLDSVADNCQRESRSCEDISDCSGGTKKIPMLKTLLKEPKLYVVGFIYMCGKVGVMVSKSYIPLYVNTSLGMDKVSVAVMPLIIYISGCFSSAVMRKSVKKFGEKWVFVIGETVTVAACIWIYFITQESFQQVYVASILFGAGMATIHVTSLAMITDLIVANAQYGATVFGIMGFVAKMAQGISFVILQNYNPCGDAVTEECVMFYKVAMVAVIIATVLVSFLVLIIYEAVCKVVATRSAITKSIEESPPSIYITRL